MFWFYWRGFNTHTVFCILESQQISVQIIQKSTDESDLTNKEHHPSNWWWVVVSSETHLRPHILSVLCGSEWPLTFVLVLLSGKSHSRTRLHLMFVLSMCPKSEHISATYSNSPRCPIDSSALSIRRHYTCHLQSVSCKNMKLPL